MIRRNILRTRKCQPAALQDRLDLEPTQNCVDLGVSLVRGASGRLPPAGQDRTMAPKKLDIGLRQAKRLCNMTHDARLSFIAEGLPTIMKSAQGFWDASCTLKDKPREADVLEGFATEEAAKILILMDVVRCPVKLVPAKIGTMVSWFYDHLARLIYAEAIPWAPMHVTQLREYVKVKRKAHSLEGHAGESILPNWNIYLRESRLYVDVEAFEEDGEPHWSTPTGHSHMLPFYVPSVLQLVEAMSAVGIFTKPGIKATSEVWGKVEFKDTENHEDCRKLTEELLARLITEELPSAEATENHVNALFQLWQLPMYDFDFTRIDVPLNELKDEQEALLWSKIGNPW
jgi:hypothetical protein